MDNVGSTGISLVCDMDVLTVSGGRRWIINRDPVTLDLDGSGLWGAGSGKLTGHFLFFWNPEDNPVEGDWDNLAWLDETALVFVFDKEVYRASNSGLPYTDNLLEQGIKDYFKKLGVVQDVYYSEQGRQGDNFVDLDVDRVALRSELIALAMAAGTSESAV
jgi:hypothetical protein